MDGKDLIALAHGITEDKGSVGRPGTDSEEPSITEESEEIEDSEYSARDIKNAEMQIVEEDVDLSSEEYK